MRRAHLLITALMLAVASIACVPPPTAPPDTLDLGGLGRFAEPAAIVEGRVFLDFFSTRSPNRSSLIVRAIVGDAETALCVTDSAFGLSLPTVGSYGPAFGAGLTRTFSVGPSCGTESETTVLGFLTITELATGPRDPECNGCDAREITRLRASFTLILPASGVVSGAAAIG